jgi:hypothetical protein
MTLASFLISFVSNFPSSPSYLSCWSSHSRTCSSNVSESLISWEILCLPCLTSLSCVDLHLWYRGPSFYRMHPSSQWSLLPGLCEDQTVSLRLLLHRLFSSEGSHNVWESAAYPFLSVAERVLRLPWSWDHNPIVTSSSTVSECD